MAEQLERGALRGAARGKRIHFFSFAAAALAIALVILAMKWNGGTGAVTPNPDVSNASRTALHVLEPTREGATPAAIKEPSQTANATGTEPSQRLNTVEVQQSRQRALAAATTAAADAARILEQNNH